jgi:DNA-binding MarR family transcriptional regulator
MAVGRLSRRLRRPGLGELTQSQLSALATISVCMPVRLGDLAAREGVSPSTLSRVVDQLVERGMVTRTRDSRDARSSRLSTTRDGAHLLEDLRRNGTTLILRAFETLDAGERDAVSAAIPALERLADVAERVGCDVTSTAARR